MPKLKHNLVWAAPLIIFLFAEYIYFIYARSNTYQGEAENPFIIYFFCIISVGLVLSTIFSFTGRKNIKEFFGFAPTPAMLVVSQFALMLFFESVWLSILLPAIFNSFLGIFLENIYLRYYRREKFQDYSFGNISGFLSIFIIYSFSAAMYGFIRFLGLQVWLASLLVLCIALISVFQSIWMMNYRFVEKGWAYLCIIPLVLLEFFWVINFLPSSIYVNGFMIALLYYIFIGLAKNQILGLINKNILARYLCILFFTAAIILLTAKWS